MLICLLTTMVNRVYCCLVIERRLKFYFLEGILLTPKGQAGYEILSSEEGGVSLRGSKALGCLANRGASRRVLAPTYSELCEGFFEGLFEGFNQDIPDRLLHL